MHMSHSGQWNDSRFCTRYETNKSEYAQKYIKTATVAAAAITTVTDHHHTIVKVYPRITEHKCLISVRFALSSFFHSHKSAFLFIILAERKNGMKRNSVEHLSFGIYITEFYFIFKHKTQTIARTHARTQTAKSIVWILALV